MLLELENIRKTYPDSEGTVTVLDGVSLSLAAGETLAITGESGSGKSTLLHVASGLEPADAGAVRLAGKDLTTLDDAGRAAVRRSDISLVFQQFNLIPSLSVRDNIAFQARIAGQYDPAQADALAEMLGLHGQMSKYPEALSGGQQQRVAIARAMAVRPKLLLADEPTGNLDETTAETVLDQMLALVTQTGAALMVVTHSPKIAARMDREVHLRGGVLA